MTTEVKTLAQAQAIVERIMHSHIPLGDFDDLLGVSSYLRSLGIYLENSTFSPDWSKAPAWAQYVAMYDIGSFKWFECKPRPTVDGAGWVEDSGRVAWDSYAFAINTEAIDWRRSLVARPQVEPGAAA